jgi:protoporphyrinogen oxidase
VSSESAVVGAGVLGLAVAQRLRDRGDNVTVLEASPDLGGLAAAWDLEGVTWDRHYHLTLPTDARTIRLLRSVGLERELRWVQTVSGVYGGPEVGLRPLSNLFDFLKLPRLRPIAKARLAATLVATARQRDSGRMEAVSAEEWLTKWSGRRTFERFWRPLLHAKVGDEWHHTSAVLLWATMQRLHAARRRGLRIGRFGYVPGGYARIFERYADLLTDSGVKINAGTPVLGIDQTTDGLRVRLEDGEAVFDRVVVTTAAPIAADLCPGLSGTELERLRSVRYVGVVCASVLLPHKISPYFLTYVADPDAPFAAMVEMASLVDPAEMDGWNLVYLARYTSPDDPLLDADDAAVRDLFLSYLERLDARVEPANVGAFKVSRVRRVFAVPTVGYSRLMPSTTTSIPGLQLIGSANLPYVTLNVNDTLALLQELR